MKLRSTNLEALGSETFDVLILGGGINGAVAAASLAHRGARVALIDRGDFAGFTSQQSSNLVWGGIKYMESFEFPLVRKLCLSRNHLIRMYPPRCRRSASTPPTSAAFATASGSSSSAPGSTG